MPVREHPAVFMAKPDMTTPTVRFFDSGKQKTDPPPDFKIFRNRNTHLYQLGAKSAPGTGDFDDMDRGLTTFRVRARTRITWVAGRVRSAPHFFESRRA